MDDCVAYCGKSVPIHNKQQALQNLAKFLHSRPKREGNKLEWPFLARAAISLTYDDGNANNLDNAVADLNDRDIHGTFYLKTSNPEVHARIVDWKSAFNQGHEIGNHTVNHPCRGRPDWLSSDFYLENYTLDDIMQEVSKAAQWLDVNIGADPGRTFAYPCCNTSIGDKPDEASYDAAIRRNHFAARVGGDAPNDPNKVNLLRIRSYACVGPTIGLDEPNPDPAAQNEYLQRLKGHCEEALATGSWTVLMFHGIGGPSHRTERDIHQRLLDYLQTEEFWVAPVRDVASFILQKRGLMHEIVFVPGVKWYLSSLPAMECRRIKEKLKPVAYNLTGNITRLRDYCLLRVDGYCAHFIVKWGKVIVFYIHHIKSR
jgi:peptidoglycan/xylan/chitin deacetylase (PgdA/CDA1 family)